MVGIMANNFTIYHNPRCSKSRQTLAILEDKGIQADIVLYLETPPSPAEIKSLLKKLGLGARELIRKNEDAYKALNLADSQKTENELISAMANNAKLIERPIVVKGKEAVLGRPPENVLKLL